MHLAAAKPSLLDTCGHLATPVSAEPYTRVRYPDGAWQLLSEWSGFDEAAMEEGRGGYGSYQYDAELRARGQARLRQHPRPFLINSDFSLAFGLRRSRAWPVPYAWPAREPQQHPRQLAE